MFPFFPSLNYSCHFFWNKDHSIAIALFSTESKTTTDRAAASKETDLFTRNRVSDLNARTVNGTLFADLTGESGSCERRMKAFQERVSKQLARS
jgi:hypothetical protein